MWQATPVANMPMNCYFQVPVGVRILHHSISVCLCTGSMGCIPDQPNYVMFTQYPGCELISDPVDCCCDVLRHTQQIKYT